MGLEKSNRARFALGTTGASAFCDRIVVVLGELDEPNDRLCLIREDGPKIYVVTTADFIKPPRAPSPWPRQVVLDMYEELFASRPPPRTPTDMLWWVIRHKLNRWGEGGLV